MENRPVARLLTTTMRSWSGSSRPSCSSISSPRRSFCRGADPEIVRRRVSQFFEQVSHCIVTHGGIVEKFAGDAVMAAFGVPLAHEDDAERAVRAGLATLERVGELGLAARIGIESGEVVTEDDAESTFATGEAVNLAARLQQEAGPGEILVGPGAARLVRDRIELDPVGPLELRGWEKPVAAHRVVCVVERTRGSRRTHRGLSSPLVGRESELELLENTFTRAVRDRRASLFTLYGDPGVGKSRLAREFVAGLEGATVLMGRCLPYGEGVTYWPLAEMVKASAGITDDDPLDTAQQKLRDCCEDEAVADLLGLAVGVLEAVEGERGQQEIAWAARTWTEQLAQAQPLVLDVRGRPLGRGAAARADRAPGRLRPRGAAHAALPRAQRAARHQAGLGRRPRARDRDRARATAAA